MTDEVKSLVVLRAPAGEIVKVARMGLPRAKSRGMMTMLEDGLDKVLSGATTLDEVLRVTKI